jgi:UDP-N-acetylmuramoyl-tripeptide--D-alanyl-D-alanine ligase
VSIETSLVGLPGALAIAAGVAVADSVHGVPVPADALNRAFARDVGEPGRLCPIELSDRTLIVDDSYNANPASVRASVEAAREIATARSARLVLVIGEMRELGSYSSVEHASLGEHLADSGAVALFALGGEAERFVAPARARGIEAAFFELAEGAVEAVARAVAPGDVVLVKASRGVHAEHVVEALIRERGRAA